MSKQSKDGALGTHSAVAAMTSRGAYVDHLKAVLRLAESYSYERAHTHQVTYLALKLFDELAPIHQLGREQRFWLNCASLVHDIGRAVQNKGHHKIALKIMMDTPLLPFDKKTRRIIGSIARYHTKALPSKRHGHFERLDPADQDVVMRLSSILRLADALDRTHRSLVRQLWCESNARRIIVWCVLRGESRHHKTMYERAQHKGRLLEKVFKRNLVIECVPLRNL